MSPAEPSSPPSRSRARTRTKVARVLITNCVAQNGGDAAILHALIAALRRAFGAEIAVTIVDDAPTAVAALFPELRVIGRLDASVAVPRRPRRLYAAARALQRVRLVLAAWLMARGAERTACVLVTADEAAALHERAGADLVVSTGGTYLVERYAIAGRLLEVATALAMRRPLVLFTQSLGPFERRGNRAAVKCTLSRARLVLLRDERSDRHLRDAGLSGANLRVAADCVFGMTLRDLSDRPVRRVAISVRDWPYADASANAGYRTGMASLTRSLVARGCAVTFLSTCQGAPAYRIDDSAAAVKVVAELEDDIRRSVTVDRAFHAPEQLVERLTEFDLVVATRMHMAILALTAGVPVFPIAYEFKTQELFTRLGLGGWVRDFAQVAEPGFPADVTSFVEALPELRAGLRKAVEREHASAVESIDLIRAAVA